MLITMLLLMASPLFAKRKDDVVVMKNGDTFTGEIKGLQYGELIFKSDYMKDSVHLDWKEVASLRSQDVYIVALGNGRRVTEVIDKMPTPTDEGREFKIIAEGSTLDVGPPDVIAIQQREVSFWNQLTDPSTTGSATAAATMRPALPWAPMSPFVPLRTPCS